MMHRSPQRRTTPTWAYRCALRSASLSFGAGAIHLAMATSHAGEWLAEGVVFAIAGWLQIGLALAFAVRPSKAALVIACVANLLFVAAWAWTRTVGMPFGPEQGNVHETGFVDVTAAALEMAIVVLCALALAMPTAPPDSRSASPLVWPFHLRARARDRSPRVAECSRSRARRRRGRSRDARPRDT